MNRVNALYARVDAALLSTDDLAWRRKFTIHLYGVAQCAALLAGRRGLDPELSIAAGILHDISAVTAGNYDDHCARSAEIAKSMLTETGRFTPDEIRLVHGAIALHDDRHRTDTPFDDVLKDADILHPYLLSLAWPQDPSTQGRLSRMLKELGL